MDPILHLSIPVADLADARAFYVDLLGCRPGRVREGWFDVWFFGLQLTLHHDPAHVLGPDGQGTRHFGVTLDPATLDGLLDRLEASDVTWRQRRTVDHPGSSVEQTKSKVEDPSGNVVELKSYADPEAAFAAG